MRIYLIIGESGEYSSYTSSPVEAWSDKTTAATRLERLSKEISAAVEAYYDQQDRFFKHRRNYRHLHDYEIASKTWVGIPDVDRPKWEQFLAPLREAEAEHNRQWVRSFWEKEAPLLQPVYDRFYLYEMELDQRAASEELYCSSEPLTRGVP